MDLIDRDKLLEDFAKYVADGFADSAEDYAEYSKIIAHAPTVQAVPIEKIQTLINDIEIMRTSPALIDNDDVQRFAENVLYALNRLIERSDTE